MGSKLQDDDEVNIGALIIRIRYWGPYNIVIIRNPQNRSPQVVRGGGSGTHYRPPTVLFPRNWA